MFNDIFEKINQIIDAVNLQDNLEDNKYELPLPAEPKHDFEYYEKQIEKLERELIKAQRNLIGSFWEGELIKINERREEMIKLKQARKEADNIAKIIMKMPSNELEENTLEENMKIIMRKLYEKNK